MSTNIIWNKGLVSYAMVTREVRTVFRSTLGEKFLR